MNSDLNQRAGTLFKERRFAEVAVLLESVAFAEFVRDAELAIWLADSWRRVGRARDALELVQSIANSTRESNQPRLELERLNLEGILRYAIGDLIAAETCWSMLHARALQAEDHQYVARANNNLGIIFTLQARPLEAVTAYERAVSAYRVTGWQRGIAQTHLNLAITYRDLGHYNDAAEHFDAAIRYAVRDGSQDELARAEAEQALLVYWATRDGLAASQAVRSAMRKFAALQDPTGHADAMRVLSMIELGENEFESAAEHALHALEHARTAGHQLLQGEALVVLAAAATQRGNQHEANVAASEAFALFQQLQAPLWGMTFRDRVTELTRARFARYTETAAGAAEHLTGNALRAGTLRGL